MFIYLLSACSTPTTNQFGILGKAIKNGFIAAANDLLQR